ncbi:MAG: hypothetical protein LLG40_13940 [Deltaproteobacteria bacterium]|nr:hypothetical protein [Deltaproteobacteria bacterium]
MSNLPAVLPKKAIENIREKFPAEAAALEAVVNSNIIALGLDEAFALRDKDGDIRAFKQNCRLSVNNGGLVSLPVGGGTFIVSAQGFEIWAEKAAASVIFPTEVIVYGKKMENPAQLTDKDGNWTGWAVRAAAFRFSSMGIPQVSDRTVIFDIDTWKNIDFLAKAKKFKQAFRIKAKGSTPPEEKGEWIEYPFDRYSSLWVNASHEEAIDWYAEISQRIKNSLQLAQTHAARNALKHLSGLQKAPDKSGVWDIPVIAWRPVSGGIVKWDPTTYKNLQNKVSGLISGDRSEFKEVEIDAGTDNLEHEDHLAIAASEVDETTQQETEVISEEEKAAAIDVGKTEVQEEKVKPDPEQPKKEKAVSKKEKSAENRTSAATGPVVSADQQKVLKNLSVMKGTFPNEYAQACVNAGIGERDITVEDAPAIIKEMNKILEA